MKSKLEKNTLCILVFLDGAGNRLCQTAAARFARLLVKLHFFQPLHQAFFVALLFEAAQRLLKRLVRFDADFRHVENTPFGFGLL